MPEDKTYYTQAQGARWLIAAPFKLLLKIFLWCIRFERVASTGKDPIRPQIETARRVILQHLSEGGLREKIDKYLGEHMHVGEIARLDAWQELVNDGKIKHAGDRWILAEE